MYLFLKVDLNFFLDFANVWEVDYNSALDSNKIRSATGISVNTGDLLDDGGDAQNTVFKTDADGNITITASSALDVSTSGKMRVLFSVKRINF